MIEFYPQIKCLHVCAVSASGGLFLLRGLLVLGKRQPLALSPPLRYLSYTIDSVLLTAALMLVWILPAALFANGWLAAKLALLVAYIVLGTFALKRAQSPQTRTICYLLALAVFGFMYGIARRHQPLGVLTSWLG